MGESHTGFSRLSTVQTHFVMKTILPLILCAFCFYSCKQENKKIVKSADYESYLTTRLVAGTYSLEDDMNFWQERLQRMPNDEASKRKLAGLHSAKFRATGLVEDLKISDSIYNELLATTTGGRAGLFLGLAQNSITQHQFNTADVYADSALAIGERKAAALLVSADIALELGNYPKAKYILKQFVNRHSFAHLIRQVKVKDQQGDLDSAILIMEAAYERVKGNEDLYSWSLSNLADMYGHAGRIQDAYNAYLAVLQKKPDYDYALKGIAWIALSHDKNFIEAKRIIQVLAARSRMPEANLMLAQIAELENDQPEKQKQLERFISLTDNDGYHTMYAKYLALLYAEDLNEPEKSLAIAEQEIVNRPTPQSYDLKAWALLKLGREKEALAVASRFVEGRTFEPDAAYHLGIIHLANKNYEEAERHLEEASRSSFELGPVIARKIDSALNSL